jgi:hypothetical protein
MSFILEKQGSKWLIFGVQIPEVLKIAEVQILPNEKEE